MWWLALAPNPDPSCWPQGQTSPIAYPLAQASPRWLLWPIWPAPLQSWRPVLGWVSADLLRGQGMYHFLSPNAPKHPQMILGTKPPKATIQATCALGHSCFRIECPVHFRDLQTWPHFPAWDADLSQHCPRGNTGYSNLGYLGALVVWDWWWWSPVPRDDTFWTCSSFSSAPLASGAPFLAEVALSASQPAGPSKQAKLRISSFLFLKGP